MQTCGGHQLGGWSCCGGSLLGHLNRTWISGKAADLRHRVDSGWSLTSALSPCPSGPSREECIHCAPGFHFQDWRCVPACGEGFYAEDMPGLPHKVCRR